MRRALLPLSLFLMVSCDADPSRPADGAGADLPDGASGADLRVEAGADLTVGDHGTTADQGAGDQGATTDQGAGADLGPGNPGTVIQDSVKGRVWPQAHGEAMVCLWQDDKLGAISYTIDDNQQPDHAWWQAQSQTYGFKLTWFVITGRVGTGAFWGTWSEFANLRAKGHDIQSHTVTHLDGSLTIDQEYKDSAAAIEANIPGAKVLVLAYPGGTNSSMNDPTVAKKYYVGARGTTGTHNQADNINYMQTNSLSASWNYATDHWASLTNIVTYNPSRPKSYRAWQCMHFHGMDTQARADAITGFQWVQAHKAEMWTGLFREVILYGQERDAVTLSVPLVNSDHVVLTLTDGLDDSVFNYPLTLKVGLDASWTTVTATQGGQAVPVTLVTHSGKPFALVSAVPDAGQVVLGK